MGLVSLMAPLVAVRKGQAKPMAPKLETTPLSSLLSVHRIYLGALRALQRMERLLLSTLNRQLELEMSRTTKHLGSSLLHPLPGLNFSKRPWGCGQII